MCYTGPTGKAPGGKTKGTTKMPTKTPATRKPRATKKATPAPARTVTTTTTAMDELIAAVREFATRPRNYNNGWDLVVEVYTDETLADMIYKARTPEGAIANVRTFVKDAHSVRQEIQNTAF